MWQDEEKEGKADTRLIRPEISMTMFVLSFLITAPLDYI